MKITMFEIEASAEDLRSSRSVADTLVMAIQRIADALCTVSDVCGEVTEEEEG